jgi:hypothetical protein
LIDSEAAVTREVRPALRDQHDDYLFSTDHLDNAYRIEAEMLVAFARQCLYQHPGDPYDTPTIRQRRQEAASAALDLLWALMAHHNVANGDPPPTPALLALRLQPQRRRVNRGGSGA